MAIVGIDVSKSKIDVHVLLGDKKPSYKIFENNKKGFKELIPNCINKATR